jgi:hypothetical protein
VRSSSRKQDQPNAPKPQLFTLSPVVPSVSDDPPSTPEFLRLPLAGKLDPIFSLSRSTWNNLILPSAANNFKPPIRSISVRRPGTRRWVLLISAESARAYFHKMLVEQGGGANG